MPPSRVHFNGSVNLPDAETVMREISARVPAGVARIPDGETGDRGQWIGYQLEKFLQSPSLVAVGSHDNPAEGYRQMPKLRLADGVDPASVSWPDLGYAAAYSDSYQVYRRLYDEGVIAPGVRFQVQYPTPLASVNAWIVEEHQDVLLDSYAQELFADLGRFLRAVPHDQVAVQWDVAVEFAILEGAFSAPLWANFGTVIAGLISCVEQVPDSVPVGLHLCYGDYGHRHFKQPESLAKQVRVLNAVTGGAGRAVSFASFTVPQYQRHESYFAPLVELDADPEPELNFGIVPYHPADQAPGTTADQIHLIDGTLGGLRSWGICTECGMGRVPREQIPGLLDLHRQILAIH